MRLEVIDMPPKPIGSGYAFHKNDNGPARISGECPFHAEKFVKRPGARSLHFHDFFELELVIAGRGETEINGSVYPVTRGTLFLMRPTDVHRYIVTEPLTVWSLRFGADYLESELTVPVMTGELLFGRCEDAAFAEALCRRAEAESRHPDGFTELAVRRIVSELVIAVLRGAYPQDMLPQDNAIRRAAAYIAADCGRTLTVSNVAAAVGLSPNYLGRVFTERMGMSLPQYVKRVRLFTAAGKIANTAEPLGNIAIECGFGSPPVLSRAFKEFYGLTPGEYRARSLR